MPVHCSAYSCTNRRTVENRARGITFHKFPKDKALRKKWEVALRRNRFAASASSVLCSAHFKEGDFDRTGQIVRLRDGIIPSIFSFPAHLQRPEKQRSTSTSRRAQESLPVACQDAPKAAASHPKAAASHPKAAASHPKAAASHPPPQPDDDHAYALPASPAALKTRLNEALARVETLEREKKNAIARAKRAKATVISLLEDFREDI